MARTAAVALALLGSLALAIAAPGLPMKCADWAGPELCNTDAATGITTVAVNADGGGAMESDSHFINGYWALDMKLPKGNSGGVNFAWYVMDSISATNKDLDHAEIDMEFYGNTTSDTVMLALNVFCGGKQNLAQFRLPFDPAEDFHTYAMMWNARQIVWLVDGKPLRILNNVPGNPWPKNAMKAHLSTWATPWTELKADYTNGPIGNQVKNLVSGGCAAEAADVAAGGAAVQCPGPWNSPLTPAQVAAYPTLHNPSLIVDYGWDNA